MNHRVLLVSKANTDEGIIKAKLINSGFDVITSHNSREAIAEIATGLYHLVIFNLKNFDYKKVELSKQLRADGHDIPLIALADNTDSATLLEIESLQKTVVLQKPYNNKDLSGLVKKLVFGNDVGQQIHRRFRTNQTAHLEIYPTGQKLSSHIFNLSHSGAYIEVPQEASFNTGDMVKLNVRLHQINRQHKMHAEVIWVDEHINFNDGRAVGIRFLDKDEVYSHMLENL